MSRTALVTGGTRGIGRGVAEVLVANGWTVLATGANDDEVAAAASWLCGPGSDSINGQTIEIAGGQM